MKEITLKLQRKTEIENEKGLKHSYKYVPTLEESEKDLTLVAHNETMRETLGLPESVFDEVTITIGTKKRQTKLTEQKKNEKP